MNKKTKEIINYPKSSMTEKKMDDIGKEIRFSELETTRQIAILDYIKNHGIDLKIFGQRWYDILSDKFYVIEYKLIDKSLRVGKEEKIFESFNEFFDYVRGDIYDNSCFYGYKFSNSEIKKNRIDIRKINRDSFTHETIDSYSFDKIQSDKAKNAAVNVNRMKEMLDYIKKCDPVSTLDDLEKEQQDFVGKFNFYNSINVFFSFILRRDKEIVKKSAIEFACKHDIFNGISFGTILFTYGRDSALKMIDNYVGECSCSTRRKRIKDFKDILTKYDSGTLRMRKRFGFDFDSQLYFVFFLDFDTMNSNLNQYNFFENFDEFISFVDGDLCGANLLEAPVSKEEISKYKTDGETKFPLSKEYRSYEIKKEFINGKFVVSQKWIDANDIVILESEKNFDKFFDFVHFLNGDLSNANLLLCDGIENIKSLLGLKFDGIIVRSNIAEKLGLQLNLLPDNMFKTKSFKSVEKNELDTVKNLLMERSEDYDYTDKISYITDIHLLYRLRENKCRTAEDIDYVISKIAKTIDEQSTSINLIGGDTSGDFDIFQKFVINLSTCNGKNDFFFTLGNHELWAFPQFSLKTIIEKYRAVLEEKGHGKMHLVQNNLFYMENGWEWNEVTEEELSKMSLDKLRDKMRSAKLIIFGGIGFAGMSDEFNADNGIYMGVLDREGEAKWSTIFLNLYEKVTNVLKDKNLIILTHMPMKDWGGENIHAKRGIVYVNGHTHRNFFYDDGKKRIYADNQVGYRGRRFSLKQLSINIGFDWFANYKNGIYEITKNDYLEFYHGIGKIITFNREYEKIYMIKRERAYMFLMKKNNGNMFILNGGSIKKIGNNTPKYFYENLPKYSESVRLFLSKYEMLQKDVSSEIKRIGGDGRIHGCIVDINLYNHLYINPLNHSIIPYYADSMVRKYVYNDIQSLLKNRCPELLNNYEKSVARQSCGETLIISNNIKCVTDTDMYRISRIISGLQYTTEYNVTRLWNDSIAASSSEENGKLIVSSIIYPETMPKIEITPKVIRKPKSKIARPIVNNKDNINIRDDKYKRKIDAETNGKIICLIYRGSTKKADYKCNVCGYQWSTRPDHFKDNQNYQCPKCKALKGK